MKSMLIFGQPKHKTMTTFTKALMRFSIFHRIIAITLIVIGTSMLIFRQSVTGSQMLMTGLFLLITVSEKNQDERSMSLKASSIFIAFIIAYTFKITSHELYHFNWLPMEMTEINHFIILVLALTNMIYYCRLYFTD